MKLSDEEINKITDDILKEILEEEKIEKIRKEEIIKNGCPHINKVERIATISRIHFLECDVCLKQFYLNGKEIK